VHPSLSVILFTTVSGAGYGLLALVGLLAPFGAVPHDRLFGLVSLALALAAITTGLISSMFHLGQPRRAWRAFSQWRSSWLSREGVASVATYLPAGLFTIAWVFFGIVSVAAGLLAALGAVVTVVCTAMIYRSLKPIPNWDNQWVVPNYLALALMSGTLWLALVLQVFEASPGMNWLAVSTILIAALLKVCYWRHVDRAPNRSTAESATGLGAIGTVRLFEAPHTSDNYLMKEMGFRIARKHAAKLRRVTIVLGFGLPVVFSCIPLVASGWPAIAAMVLAVASAMTGILAERWLFFAEAKHVVTLYYGQAAA
jgi:DMSO reductase anchor subunit